MLPLLAAAATPLEKLQNVSGQFWLKIILGLGALMVLIFLFKKVMGINKIILTIICCVICGIVGFSWIYQRSEPAFLTPVVDAIAPFFPSGDYYGKKQQADPGKPGPQKATAPVAQPAKAPATSAQPAKK